MQLTENVLNYRIPNIAAGEFYIDIAESMSMVNRKLHRQQGLWTVLGVNCYAEHTVGNQGAVYEIAFGGAPRNWVTRNALVKAFSLWKEQQAKAYRAAGGDGIKPRWQDFKVYLNQNSKIIGNIRPVSGHMFGAYEAYKQGEWKYSKIVYTVDDGAGNIVTQEPTLWILGDNNGSTDKGLILQYQDSRALVTSPDPDLPGNLEHSMYMIAEAALGEQIREITKNMDEDNDEPPYDQDEYPGVPTNAFEPQMYSFGTNSSLAKRKISLPGFSAPNGLIEFQVDLDAESNLWIQLIVGGRRPY